MIKFYSRVKKVERKSRMIRAWKEGDDVKTEEEDLGFFMLLEGGLEYLYVGRTEPPLQEGDKVVVTIAKV